MFNKLILPLVLAVFIAGCNDAVDEQEKTVDQASPESMAADDMVADAHRDALAITVPADYSRPESWLCRPGRDDKCAVDLTTTIIGSDGTLTTETFTRNPEAPVDCFYVYPTVSMDETANSDMNPGPGETRVIAAQFARFGAVCRTFAPLYRQVTLTALRARIAGEQMPSDPELGYNDVKAAWQHYLANDNDGRGVVLIGHSQGSGVLTRLIGDEIDGKPVQDKLVSAMLIGTRLPVPKDKLVGGAFQHIPLCTSADQTGCVISFASFRDNIPPPADGRFGRVQETDMVAACTNPASLGGGSGELHAYMSSQGSGMSSAQPKPWVSTGKEVTTPFVSLPGMLTAECANNEHGSYLSVSVYGDPEDPRVDDITGDVVTEGQIQAGWGLHLIDMNLAMGNLIDIVATQSEAFRRVTSAISASMSRSF